VATGKEEESATKAACGGGGGGGECSGGDGERRSRVDAGTGNDARCPEVGLISTWKTGSIGWRSSLGRLPNTPVEWPVKTFHAACLHGEMAGNPAGKQDAKRALRA